MNCPVCTSAGLTLYRESRRVQHIPVFGIKVDTRITDVTDYKVSDHIMCELCESWFIVEVEPVINSYLANVSIISHAEQDNMAIPPGATLREIMEDRGDTLEGLAERLRLSLQDTAKLLAGHHRIDSVLAHKLEAVAGPSASFWLNLERSYRQEMGMYVYDIIEDE